MANVVRTNGFRPVKYLNGAPYNGAVTEYFIPSGDSTAVFVGDLVKLDGTSDPAASGGKVKGVRSVIQAAASDAVVGVVVGFAIDPTNLNTPQYRAASTGRYVLIADDPNILFEVQEDADGGTLALASIGLNANFVVGSGSTTTGASGMQLDTSTVNTTATLPLKIMEFSQRQDNEGAVANSKVVVKLNNHQLGSHTGTAGV